jgi:tRNA pseudouridine55 synthase
MNPSHDGLLLVDKPAGPTSHDVVEAARRALRERRIGHTGTLDPAATGLLVLCVGRATRLQHYLLSWPKTYRGEIRLGWATTTYDVEGELVGQPAPVPALDDATLAVLAKQFGGELDQLPPPYSAKKTGGKKFYELARAGEEVPLEPKRVKIHHIVLHKKDDEHIAFEVTCSSGTYLRSLAHDIGRTLGCGGHLASLRRVAVGPWHVSRAVAAEVLANRPRDLPEEAFIPLSQAALPFPTVVLNPVAASHFCHGQDVVVRDAEGDFATGKEVVVRDRDGGLVGVGVALAYLPRARTLNLAPRAVLAPQVEGRRQP